VKGQYLSVFGLFFEVLSQLLPVQNAPYLAKSVCNLYPIMRMAFSFRKATKGYRPTTAVTQIYDSKINAICLR